MKVLTDVLFEDGPVQYQRVHTVFAVIYPSKCMPENTCMQKAWGVGKGEFAVIASSDLTKEEGSSQPDWFI